MRDEHSTEFRAGFVAIAGKPNVGKSTLMNALVGAKISAVSRKPQTTRNQIKGILTAPEYQIVFLDTPGLIEARDLLNEFLIKEAVSALESVDVLYHMIEANDPDPLNDKVAPVVARVDCVKFLVVNKIDRAKPAGRSGPPPYEAIARRYDQVHLISALTGKGVKELLAATVARLPVHEPYYSEDDLTDRDMRFIVAEIVREKLFELLREELPYSIATEVDEYVEHPEGKDFIRIWILVERESQKPVVVGREGANLKKVGELARAEIEKLLGHSVYLELWVKVHKNWRKSESELRRLGYLTGSRNKPMRGRNRRNSAKGKTP